VVNGNVSTIRISVEDGAVLKGGIQVKSAENNRQNQGQPQAKAVEAPKPQVDPPKTLTAIAGA
jgi:cytoskeletal protein CcmA (bactofilin family)